MGESADPTLTLEEYEDGFKAIMLNASDAFFAAYPATTADEATYQNQVFGVDINRVSTWHWAKDWYSGGATNDVFVYFWDHSPPNQTSGAYHGSELWYTFGNKPTYYNYTWTAQDDYIQEIMGNYWANFIKTGNPNGDGLVEFPAARPNVSTETMWLGNSFGANQIANSTARVSAIEGLFANSVGW